MRTNPLILPGALLFCFLHGGCARNGGNGGGGKNPIGNSLPAHPYLKKVVRTTAYSHLENEAGAEGRKTARGTTLRYGRIRSAAGDWSLYPMGTQFRIAGQPHLYEIDDYGTALVGTETIDLYKPSLSLMNEWGVRHVEIEFVRRGSFEESAQILEKRTRHPHVREMYQRILPKLNR